MNVRPPTTTDSLPNRSLPNRSRPGLGLQSMAHEMGPWFHNLHLPDGSQTAPDHPLGDFPAFKWRAIAPHLPADLSGQSVLDIGCNGGFYAFELARRGASVLGIDVEEHYLRQARWAAEQYGLAGRVRFRRLPVYRVGELQESFDLVWFMGVFYHLRYPLLALDLIARVCRETLVFQTLTMPGEQTVEAPANLELDERHRLTEPGWPKMAFIEHRLANDPTNWWAANTAATHALLRSSGFDIVARPTDETCLCRRSPEAASRASDELASVFGP